MWTLVSYDIDRMHSEVKAAARAAGFQDCVAQPPRLLPNTTLFRNTADVPTAMQEFRAVVASVSSSIRIQKLFGTAVGNYWLDSDTAC